MRTIKTIKEARDYFLEHCYGLHEYTKSGGALVFIPACSMLEYLSKLVAGRDNGGKGFKEFVAKWMSQVRPEYSAFTYESGDQDLPLQLYHVLRCGIVHSFSLIPDKQARVLGGRNRSVVLCHQEAVARENVQHLGNYSGADIPDAVVLVAEDFVSDIEAAARLLFDQAATDTGLRERVLGWINEHPPVRGGF